MFMASAIDTFDEVNLVHPHFKRVCKRHPLGHYSSERCHHSWHTWTLIHTMQIVGERLAIAGMNVLYGQKQYPLRGPFPKEIMTKTSNDTIEATIIYDQPFVYNSKEITGFYLCCGMSLRDCNSRDGNWKEVSVLNSLNRSYLPLMKPFFCVVSWCSGHSRPWHSDPAFHSWGMPGPWLSLAGNSG